MTLNKNMTRKTQKQILSTVIAGKLAYCPLAYSADRPELNLDEAVFEENVISLPDSINPGYLYIQTAAKKRIDFIIRGIQKSATNQVFLAYSKSAGFADQWPEFTAGQGQLELDPESLKVLAAVHVETQDLGIVSDNPLGSVNQNYDTVILPVDLSDLTDIGTDGELIYFQALAIETDDSGNYLWETAQASEVDKFILDQEDNNNGGNSGGK